MAVLLTDMNRWWKQGGLANRTVLCSLLLLLVPFSVGWAAQNQEGASVFQQNCAVCHGQGVDARAPSLNALHQLSRPAIVNALTTGTMKVQGSRLTQVEREAVAEFLSSVEGVTSQTRPGGCTTKAHVVENDPGWNGWGFDLSNTRFEPKAVAALNVSDVPRLKLKWAFGFPGAYATFGQPTVYGGRVFAGSEDGTVYSLDAKTGCIYWTYKAPSTVKTAVSIGLKGRDAFFGDVSGNVYAVNALTAALKWKVHVDPHPAARITGSPLLWHGRLYVPVSSGEEGAAIDPKYPCCTFRGS
ncbi:MAG: PQQ-binding-like beta-propeller repeat protein, partial [Candidatus Dormibacteraceae bacterium]